MQQQSTAENNVDESSTSLFPPTSKYHPTNNGLANRKRWLVVDFDGTCTEHDTTPLLPKLAAFATRRQSSSNHDSDELNDEEDIHNQDLQQRLSQFQILEDEFMRRYSEAKSSLLSGDVSSSAGGGIEQSIHEELDALDEPSTIVTNMVSESRVLRGLGNVDVGDMEELLQLHGTSASVVDTTDDVDCSEKKVETNDSAARDAEEPKKISVRLRHGCESTLARILSQDETTDKQVEESEPSCSGWSLAVLSINWCPTLINASLIQPVLKKRRSILQIDTCQTEVPIWSNQVDGDGVVTLHVPGALAKRERIMELRRHIQAKSVDSIESSGLIVYVGDSSTDLAALIEADIGIIIGTSTSTTVMAERWGVKVVPLRHRAQHGFKDCLSSNNDADRLDKKRNILWQVETWLEIDDMLLEIDELFS